MAEYGLIMAAVFLVAAAAYRVLMQNHMARSEHDACIGVGLECLALHGIKLGRQPADEEVVAEITALRDALRDRTADEILGQPRMTAPPMLAAMGVMAVMYASTFYTDPNLNDQPAEARPPPGIR